MPQPPSGATGKVNEDRDYRYKRSEYPARGIPEYWIVDAQKAQITLLTLVDGLYEESVFQGTQAIQSVIFPTLDLTADLARKAEGRGQEAEGILPSAFCCEPLRSKGLSPTPKSLIWCPAISVGLKPTLYCNLLPSASCLLPSSLLTAGQV